MIRNRSINRLQLAILTILAFLVICSATWATTYYASPAGGGDGRSQSSPFKINNFWGVASPGDTLYLLDGTYTDSNSMIRPPSGVDGTSGNPITVRALNAGLALISGTTTGTPVYLTQNDYINLEDFNAHSADKDATSQGRVVHIRNSSYVNVRRVIAWDGDPSGNGYIFHAGSASHVLFEDCAGWGTARKIFANYQADNITYRRCFFRWTGQNNQNPFCIGLTFGYRSTNVIAENCVGTWDETGRNNTGLMKHAIFAADETYANGGYKVLGNIAYSLKTQSGSPVRIFSTHSNPEINPNSGFVVTNNIAYSDRGDSYTFDFPYSTATISYFTSIGGAYSQTAMRVDKQTGTVDYVIQQNSSSGGVGATASDYDYIMFYNNSGANYTGGAMDHFATDTDPDLIGKCGNILQYGLAEADRPKVNGQSVGAKIQYRYVDGVLTYEPLWPWPMNERIQSAMIQSGYDGKGGLDGKGGIDLTKTIFELGGGTMPSHFESSSTFGSESEAPDPPQNLTIQ
ncbi:hypothetical protein C6A37_01575 [Desulfobacteraceae bacterium SEEP-SAG9]|nr:hypothetical protein C6A37_01575 [Desulfobacteraceae bacterium SEEP-SAG9]